MGGFKIWRVSLTGPAEVKLCYAGVFAHRKIWGLLVRPSENLGRYQIQHLALRASILGRASLVGYLLDV